MSFFVPLSGCIGLPLPPQPATDSANTPAKIYAATAERLADRISAERSARTLGWGKPTVMGVGLSD